MIDSKQKEIIILFLCLLIGFVLRYYAFDRKSLWIDEIHTFNDSRDGITGQLQYYKENPSSLHPPLFFMLTHLFFPFDKPERDLRVIPLIFGVFAIPMIYFLSSLFSPHIALPCTISLTLMTYHIYFSQDGRPYSLLLFLGMTAGCFMMKHLITSKKKYLPLISICFALQFYSSYSSIPFIIFSQLILFYQVKDKSPRIDLTSFLLLNGTTLLFCLPWILFLANNYRGESFTDILSIQEIGSLSSLMYTVLKDWVSNMPLTIVALVLLILLPFFSRKKLNSLILLALLVLPVGGLYVYCKLLHISQLISSKYFISFLPFFLITLFLSLEDMEFRFEKLKRVVQPKFIFLILFLASNLIILPLYYRAEKQDFRHLVNYLHSQIRDGDKIIVGTFTYFPGLLHYFRVDPPKRHYNIPYSWLVPGKEFEFKVSLISQGRNFDIYHSNIPYSRYETNQSRLWLVVGKEAAKEIKKKYPYILKGYFDGSFSFFRKFPSDASMYLFFHDPQSLNEKGMDMPTK